MKLPPSVQRRFEEFGRAGGYERARRLSAAERSRVARVAALARWTRERFGAPRFAHLGLPAADLVDKGLRDAAEDVESVESLLIAMTDTRLRREGVPVPTRAVPDPEIRVYRLLEEEHGDLAHARYNALRRQIVSFADACHLAFNRTASDEG